MIHKPKHSKAQYIGISKLLSCHIKNAPIYMYSNNTAETCCLRSKPANDIKTLT